MSDAPPNNIKRYADLFPDIISDKLIWTELFDSVDEAEKEHFEATVQELLNIRNVSRLSDEDIILLTTRMMGFNVNKDNVKNISNHLANAMPMLGLFHEIDGLDTFYKFIEFITGRNIDIEYLYSNNYEDFYTKPFGPLLVDGGDWYKTTHINLYIAELDSDKREQLRNYDLYLRKILGAFYEYCPANLVVHRLATMRNAEASLFISGGAVVLPKDFLYLDGRGPVTGISISGPSEVDEDTQHQYSVDITFSGNQVMNYMATGWNSSKLSIAQISRTGNAGFGLVATDSSVRLSVDYMSNTALLDVTVRTKGSGRELEYITLYGPSEVDGGLNVQLLANANYSNGTFDTLNPTWDVLSNFGSVSQSGLLSTSNTDEDIDVYVQASQVSRSGITITSTHKVSVLSVTTGINIVGLYIVGASIVYEDTVNQYTVRAELSDGSTHDVIARTRLSLLEDFLHLNHKVELIVKSLDSDVPITMYAEHTYRGVTLSSSLDITARQVEKHIRQLNVSGPSIVVEGKTESFTATALWDDGVLSVVSPKWTTSKYRINEDGTFTASSVRTSETVVVYASYIDATGLQTAASKTISIVKKTLSPDFLTIVGPQSALENSIAIYEALITWNDGSVTKASSVTWSALDNSSVSITTEGYLTFADSPSTTVLVGAEYTHPTTNVVYSSDKSVVLIPIVVLTSSISISGPNQVYEDSISQFTATAYFDDGTTQTIQPEWSADVVFPNINSNVASGDWYASIGTFGQLRAHKVEADTEIVVEARYFKESAFMVIRILNKPEDNPNIVDTHRIDGPSIIQVDGVGSYAQMVRFIDKQSELAVSSTWSIDVPNTVAEITPDGYLLPRANVNATINVTAIYQCSTSFVVDTYSVQLRGLGVNLESIRIDGPTSVRPGTTVQYTATRILQNGTEVNVTPSVMWSILSADGIAVDRSGLVYIPASISSVVSFTLLIDTNEGFSSLSASKIVTVSQVVPIYGSGPIGILDDIAITTYLTTAGTRSNNAVITVSPGPGEYIYFAHPVDLGIAEFTDTSSGTKGSMSGASWPLDGTIGTTSGPITIARTDSSGNVSDWYLYRSDFGGIGTTELTVTYI